MGVTGNTPGKGQRLRGKAAALVLAGMWGSDRTGGGAWTERKGEVSARVDSGWRCEGTGVELNPTVGW